MDTELLSAINRETRILQGYLGKDKLPTGSVRLVEGSCWVQFYNQTVRNETFWATKDFPSDSSAVIVRDVNSIPGWVADWRAENRLDHQQLLPEVRAYLRKTDEGYDLQPDEMPDYDTYLQVGTRWDAREDGSMWYEFLWTEPRHSGSYWVSKRFGSLRVVDRQQDIDEWIEKD